MLFGVMIKERGDSEQIERIEAKLRGKGWIESQVAKKAPVFFANFKPSLRFPEMAIPSQVFQDSLIGAWQGEFYNQADFIGAGGRTVESLRFRNNDGKIFSDLLASYGPSIVRRLNGRFAFAVFDEQSQEVTLGRDHLGVESLFVYEDKHMYVFSSRIETILECPGVARELNYDALRRSLIFNYNPAWDTIYTGIRKVKPGYLFVLGSKGIVEKPYWYLSFQNVQYKDEAEISHELNELLRDAVQVRMQRSVSPGVFISGGLDSSGVACLMCKAGCSPVTSFSYRTLQTSYDESAYARIVAEACKFDHHEIVYHPEDVGLIEKIVQVEDEPFDNLGITIATFLLGCEARGLAGYIFTGHGGDELFAGHPVYSADKIATVVDQMPGMIKSPVIALFRQLPDSDKKFNLSVKLKRFSESLAYPTEIGTYRWRIYYGNDELNHLFVPDLAVDRAHYHSLFSDVQTLYEEADVKDQLSRSLYVDFKTEVSFHIRRMDLVRFFGIQPMLPMLDYRLVESAATVPSGLKIRGYSTNKYIEKSVLAGVIPDQILTRQDKLGHSIPFKNWLRDDPYVKGFVQEVLSDRNVKRRGLFNIEAIHTMWDNHQTARQNNSHRLWMLTVLELWLSANGF